MIDIVNLDRYPIADLARPDAQAFIAQSRRTMAQENILLLEEFVRPAALKKMAEELSGALPNAYRRDRAMRDLGLYKGDQAPSPRQEADTPNRSCQWILAGDQIPSDGLLWSLFRWDALTDFIAAVVGKGPLYRSADPLAALTATVLGSGDTHGWHFDENNFVVSLLVQEPESGGQFEVLPGAMTDGGVDIDLCRSALAGKAEGVLRPRLREGALSLFRGQRCLHRVSPVVGDRQRLIALFSYDRQPQMMFSPDVHMAAFGRTLQA